MEAVLTRKQNIILFVGFATLMQELCWSEQDKARRSWIPKSQATIDQEVKEKNFGKTRLAMNKAITLLAKSEIGIGLNPKDVENALNVCSNWKKYFVQFMADKQDIQLKESCESRIRLAIRAGKKLECKHGKHLLGTTGAIKLADNIFKMLYDTEVRALNEPGLSRWNAREAGPVEFGQSMADSAFMARQFAEQCTGPEYTAREDEHASGWSMNDLTEANSSNDEYVETEFGNQIVVDYNERAELYSELRVAIMRSKSEDKMDAVVMRAEKLSQLDRISSYDFARLKYFSTQVTSYRLAQKAGKLTVQTMKCDPNTIVEIDYGY